MKKCNVASASNVASVISQRPVSTKVQSIGKAMDGRLLKIREYPKSGTLEKERVYPKQHLAASFRGFANCGFDDGIASHISVQDNILTNRFSK